MYLVAVWLGAATCKVDYNSKTGLQVGLFYWLVAVPFVRFATAITIT